ncbi:MAG: hypothetical protein ACYCXF_08820 [Thermoleophilia bacterium]
MQSHISFSTITRMLAGIVVTIVFLASAAPGYAAAPSVTPAAGSVIEAPDYSSENWADRWDYSNAEDLSVTPRVQSYNLNNLSMSGGSLSFDTMPQGFIEPIWASWVFSHGRDAGIHPADAGRYTHLSFRMWSSANDNSGQIWWGVCSGNLQDCRGAMPLTVKAGWNTYDLVMAPGYPSSWPLPWAGQVKDLRIIPSSFSSVHIEIDWMRLYQPGSSVNLSVQSGGGQSEVWWVDANDSANATPPAGETKTSGRLGYLSNGGNITFPASAFPPGTYRFFTKQAGQVSAYSSPVVVNPQPEPVVLDPNIAGGDDFATVVRGDPWDFSQSTDAWKTSNFLPGWGGWYLQGSYAGPSPNDPQVTLPLAGPIDASVYHRMTFRIGYDGPFGLEGTPGGGMVSRFLWAIDQGPGVFPWHDSQDIVVFPGWQTISIDLNTNPLSLAEDESSTNPIGWGGPASKWISELRFRPHEDPGGRTWYLDDIRLARNDRGKPNFDIKFQDNAWQAGTIAEIWADNDASGYNGTQIASGINVAQGVNTYTWNGAGVSAGTWWIYVVMRHADGAVEKAYSTGPVDMSPPPDITPPAVVYTGPSGPVAVGNPTISATFSDQAPSSGINAGSAKVVLNGSMENPCSVSGAAISCLTSGLDNGHYDAVVSIADAAGNTGSITGSFDVSGQSYITYDSYFTWYDNVGAANWVLMANPVSSLNDVTFNLAIGQDTKAISPATGYAPGQASPGRTVSAIYPGTRGGPVHVGYKAAGGSTDKALVSQRILWNGNSLEEVLGTGTSHLSNHFYWTWYDQQSAGYTNWVLVSNPGSASVYYEVTIAGADPGAGSNGTVAPGQNVNLTFPGKMGGAVEVQAWTDATKTQMAQVMASQRVLSNGGAAFNEVPGIPATELSDHYYWTWYDQKSAGASDWVLIVNPSASSSIYYEITMPGVDPATTPGASGVIAAGQNVTPTFPGKMGGPVEVRTWTDAGKAIPAKSICTQRSIFGPSFEEVPGWADATPGTGFYGSLAREYNWTWYDQAEGPGVSNWVLIANPSTSATANVTVSFTDKNTGTPRGDSYILAPGQQVTPTYAGAMGGPVKVSSDIPVISSQRVLWNGYFNEVLGTVLN